MVSNLNGESNRMMVDNLGKNMMMDTWDNKIFYPRFYDCDTICSYDNSGQLKFDVDIEMAQGYWNTSSSRLWTRIRDLMHNELVAVYNNMRQNGLSYESLMHYFYDEQIAMIPQKYYNMDYDVKYAPFADSYIGMANGDVYEHVKRWLQQRLRFIDTVYDYAPSYNNDVLTIRANTTELMTLEIETYTPVYQHLSWYNNQMDKKKIDGKTAVEFSGTAMAATDQEVLIYGGSNIKAIRGITSMNPNRMLIGSATKLIELDAPDCPLLADINSNKANLAPHTYLNKLNLKNCPLLGGNLIVNNSPLLREIDVRGTTITGLNLPSNLRNLESLKLPSAITTLMLNDAGQLHTLEFDAKPQLENISMTNCNALVNTTNFDLQSCKTVTLNNSYSNVSEIYLRDATELNLLNMLNLEKLIYVPNDEYEVFDKSYLSTRPNYKITTTNVPNCEFIITAPQRLSYNLNDNDIKPNTVFSANLLDLSNSYFTTVKLLSTTDLNTLLLPRNIKNFYCDSAFDIDTNVITDSSYEVIHEDLIEAYTINHLDTVVIPELNVSPNIIPSSSDGSLIFSIGSINSQSPAEGVWDLNGLEFDNFFTYGMNNDIVASDSGITMPKRYVEYSVQIKNANIKPIDYHTMLYPKMINTDIPITGSLDYSNYKGTTLDWAFAYTNVPDEVIVSLPEDVIINTTSQYNATFNSNYKINDPKVIVEYTCNESGKLPTFNTGYTGYSVHETDNGDGTYTVRIITNDLNNLPTSIKFTNHSNDLLSVETINTSNITDMANMFQNCYNLASINTSNWDTSKVTTMANAFYGCNSLTELDLSNFDTSNVKTMSTMFQSCSRLTTIGDISKWDTSKVTNMNGMFYNCNNLTSLNSSKWDTSNVTVMTSMFHNCNNLTSVDVSNFDTSKITNMYDIFSNCNKLTELDVSKWDTSNVTVMQAMFNNCNSLTELDISKWDTSNVTVASSIFANCTSLSNIQPPEIGFKVSHTLSSTLLSAESLMDWINSLPSVTTVQTLTLGTASLAKLTDTQKAVAINKGWNLA